MKHQFDMFYDFTGYPPFKPLKQIQLQRRIEKLANIHPEWQDKDYVEYFCNVLLNDSGSKLEQRFAHWHLIAYIDRDRCFLIWKNFQRIPLYEAKSNYFYTLTNEILFQADKFKTYLIKYDPNNQSKASIKTYILGVLKNSIREKLDLESGWHLLCNVDLNSTRKINNFGNKIKRCLADYGIKEPYISQYIFAWQYFVAVYKKNKLSQFKNKNSSRWTQPDRQDFLEAAEYYNHQKDRSHAPLQVSSSLEVTAEIIKKWMNICIQALQQRKRMIEVSFDSESYEQPQEIEENNNIAKLDRVETILKQEIIKIEANLTQVRSKIPLEVRKAIMPLCYSYRLSIFTQSELANWLKINQGTISRYISKHIETPLLNKLQELLKNQFDPDFYLNNFIATRFTNPNNDLLDRLIVETIQNLGEQKQTIIKWLYGEKLSLTVINSRLSPNNKLEHEDISIINNELKKEFIFKISEWETKYIKYWLKNYYENILQQVLVNGIKKINSCDQEIIRKKYCQKMGYFEINNLYPSYSTDMNITKALDSLHDHLLKWLNANYQISLQIDNCQTIKIIEDWLSREFIYSII